MASFDVKQILARTIVIYGLNYFILGESDMAEGVKLALTGSIGSTISDCYIQPML